MNLFYKYCIIILLIFTNSLYSYEQIIYVYAFDSYKSVQPKKTILVGEIKSKVKSTEIINTQSPIKEYDTRKDVVTVKVINRKGLKVGQTLYVVYKNPHHDKFKNALIVGEIKVTSILNHPFYGLVLTGEGNLLRVREGFFVVRTLESENIEKAYFIKRKADNYLLEEDYQRAIQEYLNAIRQDSDLVEAHASLGKVYYLLYLNDDSDVSLQHALKELEISWNLKDKFRYNKELYDFLFDYFSALLDYFIYFEKNKPSVKNDSIKILTRMIDISKECQTLSEDIECKMIQAIAIYYLMNYYSEESNPEHRKLYDQYKVELGLLLKQIEESNNQKIYLKFAEYQQGKVKFFERKIDLVQFEYVFILYYFELYKELQTLQKWKEKEKLKSLLKTHIENYYRFSNDNPKYRDQNIKILQIKNSLK